jgi:anti-anti-sigma regulatory factor
LRDILPGMPIYFDRNPFLIKYELKKRQNNLTISEPFHSVSRKTEIGAITMAERKKVNKNEAGPSGSDHLRIVVDHDMIENHVQDLRTRLLAEMAHAAGRTVVLDLASVKQIDSRGIALCIGLFKDCRTKGCVFSIEAGADLFRLFTTLKLTKVIDIRGAKAQ